MKAVPDIMRTCPKFDSCNAPICPLDPDWERRNYLKGEATCVYLREIAKMEEGYATRDVFEMSLPAPSRDVMLEEYPKILDSECNLRHEIVRASKTKSRLKLDAKWGFQL